MPSEPWRAVDADLVRPRADDDTIERTGDLVRAADAIRARLPARLAAMRSALAAWPRARSYGEGGPASRMWCWTHERDPARCVEAGLWCQGEPVPGPSDPTGEVAIAPDPAHRDRRQLDRHIANAARELHLAEQILDRSEARPASSADRLGTPNKRGCASCARLPGPAEGTSRWEPISHPQTDVKGNLAVPMALCAWCYRWTLDTGRLPSRDELVAHHDGAYVKRPA